jgi:hypothetical protein
MTDKPPTISRREWAIRQLGTLWFFLVSLWAAAGWARAVMDDPGALPWPMYAICGALFLWSAVQRLIEDAVDE